MLKGTFTCIDAHTCGNPVRVVTKGGPQLMGKNMSEKRQHFLKEFDWIRKGLMYEPRGHDMMSGSFIFPPHDPQNDFGILFIETSGCLPMCGHSTIGTVTIALEEGLINPKTSGVIRMEAPAGLVHIKYEMEAGKVNWVKLQNVASYLAAENMHVNHSVLGEISFDVSYGGNYYAIVDPQENFSGLQDYKAMELIGLSQEMRVLINEKYPAKFIHPDDETINGVSHVMWSGSIIGDTATARNAVFYGDKAIDRSPCGTGTSARMAQWYSKGKLEIGEPFVHQSFIGSEFEGIVLKEAKVGGYPAIVPSIRGWAKVYGHNTITIDDEDPYAFGFQVI